SFTSGDEWESWLAAAVTRYNQARAEQCAEPSPVKKRGRPAAARSVNAAALKKFRGEFSQEDFAGKCDVSLASIQRGERGHKLSRTTLDKISTALCLLLGTSITVADLTSK